MLYCVGVGDPKNGWYISNCDDNWYELTRTKLFQYDEEQVNTVIKQLRKHFKKKAFVEDSDKNVYVLNILEDVIFNGGKKVNKEEPQSVKQQIPEHQSPFKKPLPKKGMFVKIRL